MREMLVAASFGGAGAALVAQVRVVRATRRTPEVEQVLTDPTMTATKPPRTPSSLLMSLPGVADRRRRRRREQLAVELAPTLRLIVGHLRIGRNFTSALADVAGTAPEPLRGLLEEVIAETRVGANISDVLERVAVREKERHLSIVASAVGLQMRLGGSLAEILESVIDTIEEEDRLRRDIRALTADARLSAQILMAMPPVMLAFVSVTSPGYAEPLISDPLGRAMSAVAVVLAFVGWRWLRALGNPEVRG